MYVLWSNLAFSNLVSSDFDPFAAFDEFVQDTFIQDGEGPEATPASSSPSSWSWYCLHPVN